MAGKYDREFKLEAIPISSEEGADAFPGKGHLSVHDEQMRHLQRENERLRRERDILKKALAIFSEGR